MVTEQDTLTAEELATLQALQEKQARAAQQEKEAARIAKLKSFGTLADILTPAMINSVVQSISASMPTIDRDTYTRLERVSTILRYDALPIAQQIEELSKTLVEQPAT
jgi:hypothetical protein